MNENTKIVYGWVVVWPSNNNHVTIDLYFSSKEKFFEIAQKSYISNFENQQLVPIFVPEDFNHFDFIPENY